MQNKPTQVGAGSYDRRSRRDNGAERVSDREVPLEQITMPAAIHAWLDGEGAEPTDRSPAVARQIEFWSRVRAETASRRSVTVPAGLQQRIMAELAKAEPRAVTPWHQRPLELNLVVAVSAAAGLLAVGAAVGLSLAR